MKKYTVELTKEQLQQLGIEVEPEFTYPLYKRWKATGEVVKFTSMTEGVTVWSGNEDNKVGYTSDAFVEHTTDMWEDVAYDSDRDLWDGQPIECWDNAGTHQRLIKFYDTEHTCSFDYTGKRDGLAYNNYKALPSDRYDKWILEAYKTLEKYNDTQTAD